MISLGETLIGFVWDIWILKRKINFQIKWADNDKDPSLLKFVFKDFSIYSSDKYTDLHYECDKETITLKSLLAMTT